MKNLELKVRLANPGAMRTLLQRVGATRTDTLHQRDTYFSCPHGRLKLREIRGERSELIAYHRPNHARSRTSSYSVIPLERDQALALRRSLAGTLGVRAVVRKTRSLWMLRHTRIHLDSVQELGTFLELETVIRGISLSQGSREHREIVQALHLDHLPAIAGSYEDLLTKHTHRAVS